MKKISKEIFAPYISPSVCLLMPSLKKPFPCGDWIVATNTFIVLMIRKDLLDDSFEEVKNVPNVMRIVPEQNCELSLERKTIISALDALPTEKEKVDCPECGGDGEDCTCCKGSGVLPTGKMTVDSNSRIILNGCDVSVRTFKILVDTMDALGIEEVKIVALRNGASCMIQIADGINFIFMPMGEVDGSYAVHHINLMPK